MQAIKDSYLYTLYAALCAWCGAQWSRSRVVGWFTGQREAHGSLSPGTRLLAGWRSFCARLRLEKLLQGSIFLHPAFFAAAAVTLAPLLPTMGVLALVCAGYFSLLLWYGAGDASPRTKSAIDKYAILFAAVYGYAALTSTTVKGSLFPALLTILFVLFFLVLTGCGLEGKRLRRTVAAMTAAGVLVSLYGFYQRLFPSHFRNVWTDMDMFSNVTFRVYSTLENPNVLGEYFLLVLPLSAALALTAEGWKRKLGGFAACAVMGVCLVLTYSRGCYLGLLVSAAMFLVLLDRRFLILGLVALALSPVYLPESVLSRFTSIGDLGDTSTSYRVSIWLGALDMLKYYWFCGIGPGTAAFNTVYPRYAYDAVSAQHCHNLYLQIMCDTGVCGILVFLLLIVGYYRMMFTAIRREGDKTAKIFQIAAASAVTGFLLESMTDYTFYNYRVLLLFWAVLGLSVLFCRMGRPKEAAHD